MVRQARSEATRRKIIDSAVELINEIGYPAAGLADIIERAELTKGALYYHFDSKEAVASAIMEDGGARVLAAFQAAGGPGSPALENIVHGVFMVADAITPTLRAGLESAMRTFGGFNAAAKATYGGLYGEWPAASRPRWARAMYAPTSTPGDRRRAHFRDARRRTGLERFSRRRVRRQASPSTWEMLLPAIVQADSLGYYLEFLARQASRASTSDSSAGSRVRRPQPLGHVLERGERDGIVIPDQRRAAHPGADHRPVAVPQVDDDARVGSHDGHRRLIGRLGVEHVRNVNGVTSSTLRPTIAANAPLAKMMAPSSATASTGTGNRSSTTNAGTRSVASLGDCRVLPSLRLSTFDYRRCNRSDRQPRLSRSITRFTVCLRFDGRELMDLAWSDADIAFRDEVRAFLGRS